MRPYSIVAKLLEDDPDEIDPKSYAFSTNDHDAIVNDLLKDRHEYPSSFGTTGLAGLNKAVVGHIPLSHPFKLGNVDIVLITVSYKHHSVGDYVVIRMSDAIKRSYTAFDSEIAVPSIRTLLLQLHNVARQKWNNARELQEAIIEATGATAV